MKEPLDRLWRQDVRELLPGCRSVIALGVNYHVAHVAPDGARVSCYAWGEDYHRVVGRMLSTLTARLEHERPGDSFRAYCYTGPLL